MAVPDYAVDMTYPANATVVGSNFLPIPTKVKEII